MKICMFPNKRIVEIENIETVGDFQIANIVGKETAVVIFEEKFYDLRNSRNAAKWAVSHYTAEHARKHSKNFPNCFVE